MGNLTAAVPAALLAVKQPHTCHAAQQYTACYFTLLTDFVTLHTEQAINPTTSSCISQLQLAKRQTHQTDELLLLFCLVTAAPRVATFGWASINTVAASTSPFAGRSCRDACFGYNLAPVPATNETRSTAFLCRFTYFFNTTTRETIYGTWRPVYGTSSPGGTTSSEGAESGCRGYSNLAGEAVEAAESDTPEGFSCGCCGTINIKGQPYNTGCSTVTRFVANNEPCPGPQATWTAPAGAQICRAGTPALFGTIVPTGALFTNTTARCNTFDGPETTFDRLCYSNATYSGPPRPSLKP